jgi:hypothetical protein
LHFFWLGALGKRRSDRHRSCLVLPAGAI